MADSSNPTIDEALVSKLGPSPRLFAFEADWRALRDDLSTDPIAASIYRKTRQRASHLLAGDLLEHKKIGVRRLESARLLQGRIFDLATVSRLDADPALAARCAARAREELLATAALPDWGPGHFLDVAEYALGVAVGLDWLHDFLSPSDRDILAEALIHRALRPTFDGSASSLFWLGGKSNWTQVCHAGLAAAAIAVADREPELSARTLARAVKDQAGPNAAYAPDGVYPEGPTYWAYGSTFEVILISLLEKAFGTDFDLAGYPGFLASSDYLAQVTAPSGRYFNYADSRDVPPPLPVLHWFAAKRDQPELARPEELRLEGKGNIKPMSDELQRVYERLDALALWWHQTRVPPGSTEATLGKSLPLAWLGRGENPIAVFRSAWNDPRAIYLAIKGGSPSTSHAHMDAGSFLLEADGVRWAVDTGMQDYESLESAGIKIWDTHQSGDRWNVFRIGPESHNILRFNRAPQRVNGLADFTAFDTHSTTPSATLNLTPLYRDLAVSVTRQVSLLPDGSIKIEDDWTAGAEPVEVSFQWLTFADISIESDGVVLHQDGKTLRVRVVSPDTFRIETDDVSSPTRPSDVANPGLKRLRFVVTSGAGQSGSLRVSAEPGSRLSLSGH